MTRPNFFIVGAPKCGTTSLSEHLRTHPQVFFSTPKEVHYFATDLPKFRVAQTEPDYLALFDEATPQHVAIGEGSVHQLYSDEAIPNIKAFAPDAKIIVMLRHPVDYLYSYHHQNLYNLDEEEADFEAAWRLIPERRLGRKLPKNAREPKLLDYEAMGYLGALVERLLDVFPQEQVLFLLLEDLKSDPRGTYLKTLAFLGLEDDGLDDFSAENANKTHRSRRLADFLLNQPPVVRELAARTKQLVGVENFQKFSSRLVRFNRVPSSRVPLRPAFRDELVARYHADLTKLEGLIGRDLSHWKTFSETEAH